MLVRFKEIGQNNSLRETPDKIAPLSAALRKEQFGYLENPGDRKSVRFWDNPQSAAYKLGSLLNRIKTLPKTGDFYPSSKNQLMAGDSETDIVVGWEALFSSWLKIQSSSFCKQAELLLKKGWEALKAGPKSIMPCSSLARTWVLH